MILCNGAPKTGTHLLFKAVRLFDGCAAAAVHGHHDLNKMPPKGVNKHVEIVRNPRNAVCSMVRFSKLEVTRDNILKLIPTVLERCNNHLMWVRDSAVLTVRFEKLLTDPVELQRIAEYIGKPLIENHFKELWGNTHTFTDALSNWKDHWPTPLETDFAEFDAAWSKYGGYSYEEELNYDPNQTYLRQT